MSLEEMEKVLLSGLRHRLHGHELAPVLRAVRSELGRLLEEKKDLFEAQTLFMVLWRFEENKWGRPSYPEPVTWSLIEAWLNVGTISVGGEEPRQPGPEEEVAP